MSTKKSLPKEGLYSNLTKVEQEVLHLIKTEYLTPIKLSIRRKCSRQAIHKILKKLREKGYLGFNNIVVDKSQPSQPSKLTKYRLHGQEVNIQILWKDSYYENKRRFCNVLQMDTNTIRLYKESIEIYINRSFFSEDITKQTKDSLLYLYPLIKRLESEFKVILLKPRSMNIKIVNNHYEDTDSDIGKEAVRRRELIKVYGTDDGKLWYITDESFNFKTDETIHPEQAKIDREKINKFFNDIRDNPYKSMSELSKDYDKLKDLVIYITQNQLLYAENISSHIEAVQALAKGVNELREEIKRLSGLRG